MYMLLAMGRPGSGAGSDPLKDAFDAVVRAVVSATGTLPPQVRSTVVARAAGDPDGDLPRELAAYVDKVASESFNVGDADIGRLRAAGLTDDAIFEATVAAAVGAGRRRLLAGLAAVGGH